MTELKRCPHCGKEQTYSNKNETIEYNNKSWRTCDHCLVEMPAWNTRPIEDELNARIAQLTAQLAEWKADAERLIQLSNFKNKRANEYFDLHQQLVEKYGGEV